MIENENEVKEGSTMWIDRKAKLFNCIALKSIAKRSNKWNEKYAEFKAHDGMPANGTNQVI